MMRSIRIGLAALLWSFGPALAQAPVATWSVPYSATPFRVDGAIEEWQSIPAIVMEDPGHLAALSARRWSGPQDLSAEIRLAYDALHLYISGIVRDQSLVPVPDGGKWWEGDVIELFIDPTPPRADPRDQTPRPRPVQLFLMPLNPNRPWGVVDQDERGAARASDRGLTGIQVTRGRTKGGYTFEARIPFRNFPTLVPGARQLRFNLALGDRDAGSDAYNYMVWAGNLSPAANADALGVLEFQGPGPLVFVPELAVGLLDDVLELSPYLLVPLAIVLVVALLELLRRLLARFRIRVAPRMRRLLLVGGTAAVALGLVLPGYLVRFRQARRTDEVRAVAEMVRDALPLMTQGSLGTFRGQRRDNALLELLGQRWVRREEEYRYRIVSLERPFGESAPAYPEQNFKVRAYGLPLRRDEPLTFEFPSACQPALLEGQRLNVVCSMPPDTTIPRIPPPPVVEIAFTDARGTTTRETKKLERPRVDAAPLKRLLRECTWEYFALPGAVRSVSVTLKDGGPDVALEALTLIRKDRDVGQPLFLGTESLVGVPTEIRGSHPPGLGVTLLPAPLEQGTEPVAIDLPPPPEGFSWPTRLWLFLSVPDWGPEFENTPVGREVVDLAVHFGDGRTPPQRQRLRHQMELFAELKKKNLQEPDPGRGVAIAYEWLDEQSDSHINLALTVSLPADAHAQRLELRNLGGYAIRVRSVVLGSPPETPPTEPTGSPLIAKLDQESVRLRPEWCEALEGYRFALFRDGRVSLVVPPPEDPAAARQALPRSLRSALAREDGALLAGQDQLGEGEDAFSALLALPTREFGDAALGILRRDVGLMEFARRAWLAGILLALLAAPAALVVLAEALAAFRSLRLKLVLTLSIATLVPIGFLSLQLVHTLDQDHRQKETERIREELAAVTSGFDVVRREVAAETGTQLSQVLGVLGAAARPDAVPGSDVLRRRLEETRKARDGWGAGSFVKVAVLPKDAAEAARLPGTPVFDSEEGRELGELPLRAGSHFYLEWGRPFVAARQDRPGEGGARPTIVGCGRVVDEGLLRRFARRATVALLDLRLQPLVVAEGSGGVTAREVMSQTLGPFLGASATRAGDRRDLAAEILDRNGVTVRFGQSRQGALIGAFDVLRDPDGNPKALLGVVDRRTQPTLSLGVGQVPVRWFFLAAAGVSVALILFLSWVVADRIIRPIDRLQGGAQALAAGAHEVRIDPLGDDQVGRLTQSFNLLASRLQARALDLATLNQAMEEFGAEQDLGEVAAAAVRALVGACPGAKVRVLLLDRERDMVQVLGGRGWTLTRSCATAEAFLGVAGPATFRMPLRRDPERSEMPVLATAEGALAVPLMLRDRHMGTILLAFDRLPAPEVNLDFLAALARQTAVALENARLYRLAIEDPASGACVLSYFRRRLAEEVARARHAERTLSLVKVRLPELPTLRQGGSRAQDRVVEAVVRDLRHELGTLPLIGRASALDLEILVPEAGRDVSTRLLARVHARVLATLTSLVPRVPRIRLGIASFPADAPSAEFLTHQADLALVRGRDPALLAGSAPASGSPSAGAAPTAVPGIRGRLAELEADGIILRSPSMLEVLDAIGRVAPSDLTLLVEGETGVGKEILAGLVHRFSARRQAPLVKVNCGALAPTLLESELFGHERGAFTGAVARKLGRFEQAQGGTIFLDEIGEAPPDVQVRLLRVLQEREIERVGGSGTIRVDVRVIAATNRDLEQMIAAGRFRQDLFYRLQGMRLRVPALRERKEEIPLLAERMRQDFVRESGRGPRGFTGDAMDALYRYHWPGNLRELRNVVSRALVLARGDLVERRDLGIDLGPEATGAVSTSTVVSHPTVAPVSEAAPPAVAREPAPVANRDTERGEAPRPAASAPSRPESHSGPEPVVELPASRPGGQASGPASPDRAPVPPVPGPEWSPRQERMLVLLRARPALTTMELVQDLGVPRRTCVRDLAALVHAGVVVRDGKRRAAKYRLATSGTSRVAIGEMKKSAGAAVANKNVDA